MYKKKWASLFLILIFAIGTLTGCSPTEKEFYNLTMEAGEQTIYAESGSIDIDLLKLPAILAKEETATEQMLVKAMNQQKVVYWGNVDVNQGILQYDFSVVNKITGEKTALSSLIYKDDVLYLKIDDIINYMKKFGDTETNQELDRRFANIQYVSMTSQDFANLFPPVSDTYQSTNFLQQSWQQQMIWRSLLDDLTNKAYDKYDSNLISKDNNKYTMTLPWSDAVEILKPAAVYTINNIDKVASVLKSFLNSLSHDDLATLGFSEEIKNESLSMVDMMVLDVKQNREVYLDTIDEMATNAQKDLVKMGNDSVITSTIEKKDLSTYVMTNMMRIHITDDPTNEAIDVKLNIDQTLQAQKSISVDLPAGPITAFKDLEKRFPVSIRVEIDDGYYHLQKGFTGSSSVMNVVIADNKTYVPLRLVAESLGENVVWDKATGKAYIEQNGKRIIMDGIIVDNQTLVSSRSFEGLGYQVNWDDPTRTVTIKK
ncbi:MAG: copper amine oxidase N-terminal domain-containing protein [Syntrophomonas sp.]|nr:copper amine oxidase N-terminal domain-containing protein [Syntrophomonas sp.]